jgi:hypothetical protein
MPLQTSKKVGHSRRKLIAAFVISLFAVGIGGIYFGGVMQANADQASIFTFTKATLLQAAETVNATRAPTNSTGSTILAETGMKVTLFLNIFYAPSSFARLFVNQTLLNQGFVADCQSWCFGGINYFQDPTSIITNQGHGFEECKIFSPTGGTDTCTAANFAEVLGNSVGRGSPPTLNATDTWAGTHSSCTTNEGTTAYKLVTDGNGLADASVTPTSSGNGATVTTTLTKTFSITGTYTGMNIVCINTALHGGTNPLIYAEAYYGPDSFVSGDSLTQTWTVART